MYEFRKEFFKMILTFLLFQYGQELDTDIFFFVR